MNFLQLQNKFFEEGVGYHESAQKKDYMRQSCKDAINEVQMEAARLRPHLWGLTDETTVSIVVGTQNYYINDWCLRPISFYTKDQAARKIPFRWPANADRDGSRNSGMVFSAYGNWSLSWKPKNIAAILAGTGAAVVEGATSVTGLTGLGTTGYEGRLLRIGGDDNDYKIVSHTATTAVIDKAHRGVLSGLGTTGAAANYSSKKWEIGPPGLYRLEVLPTPTEAVTLYVRYARRPRRLIADDDVPEIPEEFHNMLWRAALSKVSFAKKDSELFMAGKAEFEELKRELMAHDDSDLQDEDDACFYKSTLTDFSGAAEPGVYSRRDYP